MAAAFQVTTRRSATQHPQALSPGASVNATLLAATGPHRRVTGLSTNPIRVPDVFDKRLAPYGTLTAPEKNGLAACHNAQAGQAMNQTSCAGSPQAQVSVEVGLPDHTCHHSTTAGNVKATMHARWKSARRTARARRARVPVVPETRAAEGSAVQSGSARSCGSPVGYSGRSRVRPASPPGSECSGGIGTPDGSGHHQTKRPRHRTVATTLTRPSHSLTDI